MSNKGNRGEAIGLQVSDLEIAFTLANGEVLAVTEKLCFSVPPHTRLALVGPSGCGKTTILRALIGLLSPRSGSVAFGPYPPEAARERRLFGFVPQKAALPAWKTVFDNVALPLKLRGQAPAAIGRRVAHLLDLFGLSDFRDFYPHEISGGMQSRTAIARALADEPQFLLLDECFGSLDELTRERLYKELSPMWHRLATTLVFVTHSISEAVYLADRILVLSPRPARSLGLVTVPAPQPREAGFLDSPVFHETTAQTRALLGL